MNMKTRKVVAKEQGTQEPKPKRKCQIKAIDKKARNWKMIYESNCDRYTKNENRYTNRENFWLQLLYIVSRVGVAIPFDVCQ